jgi:hypothetical protein
LREGVFNTKKCEDPLKPTRAAMFSINGLEYCDVVTITDSTEKLELNVYEDTKRSVANLCGGNAYMLGQVVSLALRVDYENPSYFNELASKNTTYQSSAGLETYVVQSSTKTNDSQGICSGTCLKSSLSPVNSESLRQYSIIMAITPEFILKYQRNNRVSDFLNRRIDALSQVNQLLVKIASVACTYSGVCSLALLYFMVDIVEDRQQQTQDSDIFIDSNTAYNKTSRSRASQGGGQLQHVITDSTVRRSLFLSSRRLILSTKVEADGEKIKICAPASPCRANLLSAQFSLAGNIEDLVHTLPFFTTLSSEKSSSSLLSPKQQSAMNAYQPCDFDYDKWHDKMNTDESDNSQLHIRFVRRLEHINVLNGMFDEDKKVLHAGCATFIHRNRTKLMKSGRYPTDPSAARLAIDLLKEEAHHWHLAGDYLFAMACYYKCAVGPAIELRSDIIRHWCLSKACDMYGLFIADSNSVDNIDSTAMTSLRPIELQQLLSKLNNDLRVSKTSTVQTAIVPSVAADAIIPRDDLADLRDDLIASYDLYFQIAAVKRDLWLGSQETLSLLERSLRDIIMFPQEGISAVELCEKSLFIIYSLLHTLYELANPSEEQRQKATFLTRFISTESSGICTISSGFLEIQQTQRLLCEAMETFNFCSLKSLLRSGMTLYEANVDKSTLLLRLGFVDAFPQVLVQACQILVFTGDINLVDQLIEKLLKVVPMIHHSYSLSLLVYPLCSLLVLLSRADEAASLYDGYWKSLRDSLTEGSSVETAMLCPSKLFLEWLAANNSSIDTSGSNSSDKFVKQQIKNEQAFQQQIEDALVKGAVQCMQSGNLASSIVRKELLIPHREHIYYTFLSSGRSLDYVCADILFQKAKLLHSRDPQSSVNYAIELVSAALQYVQKSIRASSSQMKDHHRLINMVHSLLLHYDILTLKDSIAAAALTTKVEVSHAVVPNGAMMDNMAIEKQAIFEECMVIANTHSFPLLKLMIVNRHELHNDVELNANMQLQAIDDMRRCVASEISAKQESVRSIFGAVFLRLSRMLPTLSRFGPLLLKRRNKSELYRPHGSDNGSSK